MQVPKMIQQENFHFALCCTWQAECINACYSLTLRYHWCAVKDVDIQKVPYLAEECSLDEGDIFLNLQASLSFHLITNVLSAGLAP